MSSLVLVKPPAVLAATTAQQMAFGRLTDDDDTSLLPAFIAAAQEQCEIYTRRRFITQTWRYYPGERPVSGDERHFLFGMGHIGIAASRGFALPFPPCQSISSVGYLDDAGAQQTLSANTDYVVENLGDMDTPTMIKPALGVVWPINRDLPQALWCEFVCGVDIKDLSPLLLMAVMSAANDFYDQREVGCLNEKVENMLRYQLVKL